MPTRDLFDPSTEQQIIARLHGTEGDETMAAEFDVAEDYAAGRMRRDVERELLDRYPETQTGAKRQEGVQPQAIPITQKFLEESATLYTRPVTRELVDEDGRTDDAATEALRQLLGESYNERMHQIERRVVLMQSAAGWFQARAGKLRLVSYGPQKVTPIKPDETTWFDPGSQDDYQAFATELAEVGDKKDDLGTFAYVERAQTVFYQGQSRDKPGALDAHPNPFAWPQTVDTDDGRGATAELPLQMLTAWHDRLPERQILADVDVPIVDLNRELNIQWSLLLDTIGHQGWTQMAAQVTDPSNPPSVVQVGPRNVIVLGPGETLQAIDSATNYTGLVEVLTAFVQVLAQSKNLSPNDFALTGATAPASGFAKLIDALPKVQSRQRLGERFARQEATIAWPRIAVIGRHLGAFTQSIEQLSRLRMRVNFADLDIPRSVDEQSKQHEFDLKHGLTTPAKLLAEREGITVDEAQQQIDENRAAGGAAEPPTGPTQAVDQRSGRAAGLLGSLIGRQSSRAAN